MRTHEVEVKPAPELAAAELPALRGLLPLSRADLIDHEEHNGTNVMH
ncbi:MAG: hypothetical protein ACXW00_07530 [Methylobacter sp.]